MEKNLVIVESPAKAKTIKKYLGDGFIVMASYGHVRDLLPKTGAVEPENGFAMHYENIEKNAKHMSEICKEMKKSNALYLAADPDREGEAICWHIYQILQENGCLKNKSIHRIAFHEITKSAVKESLEHSRGINMDLVNAQQARRALDYLVGFNLSPLLWKKVRRGLSAGRVQSPALRLIVERENEIRAFQKKEYWSVESSCDFKNQKFAAKLIEFDSTKVEQFTITNEPHAKKVKAKLVKDANGTLKVTKVEKKSRKRNPTAPFITSTLQQEAARKLGFTAYRTMRIAQQLYEGIDIGSGSDGLITYMRTDSVNLSKEAVEQIRDFICKQYGKDNIPDEPRVFKTKSKNAQEAHEAIRPTDVTNIPKQIKDALTIEQFKLYNLIWQRSVACQMIHATIDTVAVDLNCGEKNRFRANGSTVVNPGFMAVYQESTDDVEKDETKGSGEQKDSKDKVLPEMKAGDEVGLEDIICEQHFTDPPPRYSEASLIKTLEEHGIGRPSTYSSIIQTLLHREYVTLEKKRFEPTDVGDIVNKFLTNYFTKYVDYDFTANLEDQLDEVARGEKVWVPLLKTFWGPFKDQIDTIENTVQRKDVTQEALDEKCPKCGKDLSIRLGRNGKFIGCTGFPDCDYTRSLNEDESEAQEPEIVEGRKCPKCDSDLIIKIGRYGKFIGCSAYPKCKYIEPLEKPEDTGIKCPECHKANLLKRKSRRFGKEFYSCARYPDCKYAVWNPPIEEICPKCHWPIMTIKITKRRGKEKVCPQKTCGYVESAD